jgi:hypothetical protein
VVADARGDAGGFGAPLNHAVRMWTCGHVGGGWRASRKLSQQDPYAGYRQEQDMNSVLFQPFRLHDMDLANRIVLSPMTR